MNMLRCPPPPHEHVLVNFNNSNTLNFDISIPHLDATVEEIYGVITIKKNKEKLTQAKWSKIQLTLTNIAHTSFDQMKEIKCEPSNIISLKVSYNITPNNWSNLANEVYILYVSSLAKKIQRT